MRLKKDNELIEFETHNSELKTEKEKTKFQIHSLKDNQAEIEFQGKKYNSFFYKYKDTVFVNVDGRNYQFKIIEDDELYTDTKSLLNKAEINPPMPGSVVKLLVEKGDQIKEGDGLIVVEAMKMETTLFSPIDGIVSEIHVKEKDQLSGEEVLLVIEK